MMTIVTTIALMAYFVCIHRRNIRINQRRRHFFLPKRTWGKWFSRVLFSKVQHANFPQLLSVKYRRFYMHCHRSTYIDAYRIMDLNLVWNKYLLKCKSEYDYAHCFAHWPTSVQFLLVLLIYVVVDLFVKHAVVIYRLFFLLPACLPSDLLS